jgi:polyisoprenoid-binding protein YceI
MSATFTREHVKARLSLYLTVAIAALAAGRALAAVETYTLDAEHTVPMFAVSHEGISVQRGLFGRAAGTVTLDRERRSGTIDVAVDTASLVTGDALRDRVLRGEEFLDAARYPAAVYRATRIAFDGDRPTGADGELTLRGVTRAVHVDIGPLRCGRQFVTGRPICGTDLAATIKRSAFGMTAFARDIGDDVALTIQVEALKQ